MIIYFWKVIVSDKVFGLGMTVSLTGMVADWTSGGHRQRMRTGLTLWHLAREDRGRVPSSSGLSLTQKVASLQAEASDCGDRADRGKRRCEHNEAAAGNSGGALRGEQQHGNDADLVP